MHPHAIVDVSDTVFRQIIDEANLHPEPVKEEVQRKSSHLRQVVTKYVLSFLSFSFFTFQ